MSDDEPDIGPDTSVGDVIGDVETTRVSTSPDDDMMLVDGSASCHDCAHQDVCAVYANFAPQVSEEIPGRTGGEPAFEPDQLAIICEHYTPVETKR